MRDIVKCETLFCMVRAANGVKAFYGEVAVLYT